MFLGVNTFGKAIRAPKRRQDVDFVSSITGSSVFEQPLILTEPQFPHLIVKMVRGIKQASQMLNPQELLNKHLLTQNPFLFK